MRGIAGEGVAVTILTPAEMEAALDAHGAHELALDVDATMATVSADPSYEYVMLGLRADGREAVREAYRRMFAGYISKVVSSSVRVIAAAEEGLCREGFTTVRGDDGLVTCRSITVITFDGNLVSGERMYTDPFLTHVVQDAFGPDFADVPGVSRL